MFAFNLWCLGSVPLGFYRPIKATIDKLFQLGITPAPNLTMTATSDLLVPKATNGLMNGTDVLSDGTASNYQNGDSCQDRIEDEQQQDDDLNVVYSEGTQKTDLLY